jgi:hypothetical protein
MKTLAGNRLQCRFWVSFCHDGSAAAGPLTSIVVQKRTSPHLRLKLIPKT